MHLCANLSMLFADVPMAERLHLAARAGFESAEIQFPGVHEVSAIAAASNKARLPITLINVPRGGDDEVGLAALPERRDDFSAALEICAEQAGRLAVEKVNILAGRPPPDADRTACRTCLVDNLRRAADRFAPLGVKVMVEPVNDRDVPGFFLTGLAAGLEVLAEAGHPNLYLQFDFYHMAITEPDLPSAIRKAGGHIGHVQFADAPGRHEPGSGRIDFAAALAALRESGYEGAVSAEYVPAGETQAGLGWMPLFREMMA